MMSHEYEISSFENIPNIAIETEYTNQFFPK